MKPQLVSAQAARHSCLWPFVRSACTACALHTRCAYECFGVHIRSLPPLAPSIAGVPRCSCPGGGNDAVLSGTQASDTGQFILPTGRTERTISSLPRPGPQCAHAVAHTDIWHRQFPAQASIFTYIMPLRSADHVSASCGSRLDWRLGPDHHSRLWQLQLHLYTQSPCSHASRASIGSILLACLAFSCKYARARLHARVVCNCSLVCVTRRSASCVSCR